MKSLIINNQMRKIEKQKFTDLGYNLVEITNSENVYEEISAHTDIFCCKICNNLIIENNVFDQIKSQLNNCNIIKGTNKISRNYPEDIKYNVCQIGNNVIHNFHYTDNKIMEIVNDKMLNKININQGYSNCSIAVVDEHSAIVTDESIAEKLEENGIDVLVLDYKLDIKLLKHDGSYSNMSGFIGGAISRIGDKIIIFGDLEKIDQQSKIKKFLNDRHLEIVDFKNWDVVDYGGIIEC